ncbi:50S ribosomal protein L18 [Candidatus Poribacteria bacterium]|nr:50S ribosomal protein L18 [Candidatus Poribacteria bacterium]
MSPKTDKKTARIKRHRRVKKKLSGTSERPRLCIYKSIKHIYAQVINDENGTTLVTRSTLSPDVQGELSDGNNIETAKIVGKAIGKAALDKGIEAVVFDRSGYRYHGKVKALADAAREAGLRF